MKKINVLFVSHSAQLYGAEKCLLDIISRMNREEFGIHLLCPRMGELSEAVSALGIPTFVTPYKYWLARKAWAPRHAVYLAINLLSVPRIVRLIQAHDIDVVYTNTCTVISAALAARLAGKPHLWHIHETIGRQPDAFRFMSMHMPLFGTFSRLSHRVIVNSKATGNLFPERYRHRYEVVYNSFDSAEYPCRTAADIAAIKARHGIPPAGRVVAIIGSISEQKGQQNVVQAMPAILNRFPGTVLMMAGMSSPENTDYETEIRRLVGELRLSQSVVFAGYCDNVRDLYYVADVVVVPSRNESFGRVIVEAMLCGVPVIATNVGGIPEIIRHGENGMLLNSREPEAIARAVVEVFNDPDRAARFATEGRQSALRRFDIRTAINQIETITRSAAAEARGTE